MHFGLFGVWSDSFDVGNSGAAWLNAEVHNQLHIRHESSRQSDIFDTLVWQLQVDTTDEKWRIKEENL